jgi:hypothetical protein
VEASEPPRAGVGLHTNPSWDRSILTEIYICHACSDHEVVLFSQWRRRHAALAGGALPEHRARHRAACPGPRGITAPQLVTTALGYTCM